MNAISTSTLVQSLSYGNYTVFFTASKSSMQFNALQVHYSTKDFKKSEKVKSKDTGFAQFCSKYQVDNPCSSKDFTAASFMVQISPKYFHISFNFPQISYTHPTASQLKRLSILKLLFLLFNIALQSLKGFFQTESLTWTDFQREFSFTANMMMRQWTLIQL